MTSNIAAGRKIVIKVPPHLYEETVRFYRDVVDLKLLDRHLRAAAFEFGGNQLWIDRVPA